MTRKIAFSREPVFTQQYEGGSVPVFHTMVHKRAGRESPRPNWRAIFYRTYAKVKSLSYDLRRYYLIDGFIERQMRHWIKRYIKKGVVLDVGLGDARLMRHVPRTCRYLGCDVYIRESVLKKAMDRGKADVFVASATDIPLPDASVDYLLSTEVMEHIVGYKKAIEEMYRVAKPGAKLFLSIPNNYCFKYVRKGPHPEHVNSWRYQEFIDEMAPYFRVLEGRMAGFWLPLFPKVRYSYQIGWSHPDEYYNTNFLYVFEKPKSP